MTVQRVGDVVVIGGASVPSIEEGLRRLLEPAVS
jgi:hypothetical protein